MSSKLRFFAQLIFLAIIVAATAISRGVWESGNYKVFLDHNVVSLVHDTTRVVEIRSFEFNFVEPDIVLVEEVKGDTLVLRLRFDKPDGFHDKFPSQILLTISRMNNTFHFYATDRSFNHVTINLKDFNEHYFGLIEKLYPDNSKNPDLRGNVVDLEVYGDGTRDYAENYASAYSAFYMSTAGYGSFFDTFAKGRYQFAIDGLTRIYHQTGSLDWYIFVGQTGEAIHKEYFDLIGKPKYIPLWACGPIFWRDQNNGGKDEILDDVRRFTELKIPLTACFVDRPYSNGANEWSKMDFNAKFAEPDKWIKVINEKYGLQFMTWVGPMTFSDGDFPGLLSNYKGYIDLTNPEALREFERRLKTQQYAVGVRGHKMDRGDENFPVTAQWYAPVTEAQSRNEYIYLFAKVIDGFLSRAYGKDQFNFARAAFHRSQPYLSAVWGGDSRSNWYGMRGGEANAIRCGFLGFPVWGEDTGGYLGPGRIDEELYIRWLEWGSLSGMFEIKIDGSGGEGEDRPPWKYSERLQQVFRNACELRMQLLPYIYSCANTAYKNGVVMKPLPYRYLDDNKTYPIWDEYLFGNAFLVAPVFSRENRREVYLPEGKWYEFSDRSVAYTGPTSFIRDVPIESTPIYIKGNSIYVTGDIYRGNSRVWEGELKEGKEIVVHLFPGATNEKTTFDYVDCFDNDREKPMLLEHQSDKVVFASEALNVKARIECMCETKPGKVMLNGDRVKYTYDERNRTARIGIGENRPIRLELFYSTK